MYAHDAVDPDKVHVPTYYSRTTSYVSEYAYRSTYLNANIFTNYFLSLNEKHNFTFLLGTQIENFKDRFVDGSRNDVTTSLLPVLDLTNSKTDYSLGGRYQTWRTVGFFGRINYDYMNRYLLEVNLRYDGHIAFPPRKPLGVVALGIGRMEYRPGKFLRACKRVCRHA